MHAFTDADNQTVGLPCRVLMDRIGSHAKPTDVADDAVLVALTPISMDSDMWIEFLMKNGRGGRRMWRSIRKRGCSDVVKIEPPLNQKKAR